MGRRGSARACLFAGRNEDRLHHPGRAGHGSRNSRSQHWRRGFIRRLWSEFQFKAGDLNFHSTSYQWLVVANARAQFKGGGTINNTGSYGFILTAIDGEITGGGGYDRFRIKIWDIPSGTIIYDNQPGSTDDASLVDSTILQSGSIVIHK